MGVRNLRPIWSVQGTVGVPIENRHGSTIGGAKKDHALIVESDSMPNEAEARNLLAATAPGPYGETIVVESISRVDPPALDFVPVPFLVQNIIISGADEVG